MYFWKVELLKEDIRQDKLNESERFKYAIVFFALTAIGMEEMSFFPVEELNIWDEMYSIGAILIQISGIFFAYKANLGSRGTDFIGKYFAISFVISIRFSVLFIPIVIGLLIYDLNFNLKTNEEISSTAIGSLIWLAALYWRIYVHIRELNSSNN